MSSKLKRGGLIKKLDKVFSKYIRLRDSIDGYIQCCTCSNIKPIKEMHAGHFISRGNMLTRFDERNVNGQCCGCNTYKNGELHEYAIFIENRYGRAVLDELMELKRKWNGAGGFSMADLREKLEHYTKLLKELENEL